MLQIGLWTWHCWIFLMHLIWCHTISFLLSCVIWGYSVLVGWVCCFLLGRSMRVVVDGIASGSRNVRSVVLQGSVLGPLLFLVYIIHLTDGVGASYKDFADDYKPGCNFILGLMQTLKIVHLVLLKSRS